MRTEYAPCLGHPGCGAYYVYKNHDCRGFRCTEGARDYYSRFMAHKQRTKPAPDTTWMANAACKGLTALFFAEDRSDTYTACEAKAVCATCPVAEPCLEHSLDLDFPELDGVWGGKTSAERRSLRAERRRAERVA